MMNYSYNLLLKVTALLMLMLSFSGCMEQRCIDPDDFGFSSFTVSARYSKDDISEQYGQAQIAPWKDSNFKVNGRPLTIIIRNWDNGIDYNVPQDLSAWSAWYGKEGQGDRLSPASEYLSECEFIGEMDDGVDDALIANAPCLFKQGVGLYALIADKSLDPNETIQSQSAPSGINFHLGKKSGDYTLYDLSKSGDLQEAGGIIYNYNDDSSLKNQYYGAGLYFKILDKFYDDNNGQYRVVVKSGLMNQSSDPIQYVTDLVTNFLFGGGDEYGVIRQLFQTITSNPNYNLAVSTLLTLFVVFTALQYLSGNIDLSRSELISRIIKIAIVSALLNTSTSWDFFHDYLFVFFIDGIQQILSYIQEAGSTGPGSPSVLSLMIAPQTQAKLFSLLFMDPLGFMYIIIFFCALLFLLTIYMQATVIYLTALMAIGVIIIMGPIFICFMLFGVTRGLFENWLKQLTSYALQPIILFTGIIFISMIIRDEIYGSLGFKVCKYDIPKMDVEFTEQTLGQAGSIFYWWMPVPMKGEDFITTKTSIPVPVDHVNADGDFCQAYGCFEERHPDLPFLDPNTDQRRITAFHNGKFVQLDGLLLIMVAIFIMSQFNNIAVSIAKFISNTSGNRADAGKAGLSAYKAAGPSNASDWARAIVAGGKFAKKHPISTQMGIALTTGFVTFGLKARAVINTGKLGIGLTKGAVKGVKGAANIAQNPGDSFKKGADSAINAALNPVSSTKSALSGTYNLVRHPVDSIYGKPKEKVKTKLTLNQKLGKGAWITTGVATGGVVPAAYKAYRVTKKTAGIVQDKNQKRKANIAASRSISGLKMAALDPRKSDSLVAKEASKMTGLKASKLNTNSNIREVQKYKKDVTKALSSLNSNLSKGDIRNFANSSIRYGTETLQERMAQTAYGSSFDQLSDKQRDRLEGVVSSSKVIRQHAEDISDTKRYQKAYVEAYHKIHPGEKAKAKQDIESQNKKDPNSEDDD